MIFWKEHMDFIFFLYGLSFLIFSAVCATVKDDNARKIPWLLLCVFGVTHGINEILDMFAAGIGECVIFSVFRLGFLVVSYVAMCEAAVSMAGRRWARAAGLSLYLIAAFLCYVLWHKAGAIGVNAAARYALGFPGILCSALLIAGQKRADGPARKPLLWMASFMGVYAVATGLVVPGIPAWPGSVVNQEHFLKAFHFPVQLLRCVCATGMAVAVWYYSQSPRGKEKQGAQGPGGFFRSSHFIVVMLAGVILLGLAATEFSTRIAFNMLRRESRDNVSTTANYLLREFRATERVSANLSTSPWVAAALSSRSPEDIGKAHMVLDRYVQAFGASVCYLLDSSGTVIASSNRDSPQSFMGKSYAFRSYFSDAMRGVQGRYLAKGVTSNERGYYAGHPVHAASGGIIGVAVVKTSVDDLEREALNAEPFFLVNSQGAVFISNDRDAIYKSLWPLSPAETASALASKQFGPGPFTAIFPERFTGGSIVERNRKSFYVVSRDIDIPGWSLVWLEPLDIVWHYRLFTICITLFLCVLIISFFVIVRQKENLLLLVLKEKERAQRYLDVAGVMLVALDTQGKIVLLNRKGCEMLGYAEHEAIGNDWFTLCIPPGEQGTMREQFRERMRKAGAAMLWYQENEVVTRGNERRLVAWHNTLLVDEKGEVSGTLSSGDDITERKRQEKELTGAYLQLKEAQKELIQSGKMAAMGQLAAGVSHELNQPLTGIKGFAQSVLRDLEPGSPMRQDMEKIIEQADRMDKIIKNVRFFARKAEFTLEEMDVERPLKDSLMLLEEQFRVHNIRVEKQFIGGLPKVLIDPNQMQQVFLNLLTNARDAIDSAKPDGGGVVTMRTRFLAAEKMVEVVVGDNGCGIPQENIEHIFNPFFTTKSLSGGMGLGLAIVYRIMESHKGAISVESGVSKGTVFRMQLPVVPEGH